MYKTIQSSSPMWGDDTKGVMFDLHRTTKSFKKGLISKHPKSKVFIRGFVPEEYVPSEGGTFKMYHHNTGGVQKFGEIKLERCRNVIYKEEMVYFENSDHTGKYILVPSIWKMN